MEENIWPETEVWAEETTGKRLAKRNETTTKKDEVNFDSKLN